MRKKRKNNIFIISGPSGAGEDSIIDTLVQRFGVERVITTTTRSMRPGEKRGKPYYFISKEEFKERIENNEFFEWALEYNDNYYGVTKDEIARVENCGKIGIWKIEYKGVITAKKLLPGIIAIFINAPLDIIKQRIKTRSDVDDDYVKERMEYTKEWLKYKHIYDYEVINEQGKLEKAVNKVIDIIKKEGYRLK